jgi:enoyl-CoA hydratase
VFVTALPDASSPVRRVALPGPILTQREAIGLVDRFSAIVEDRAARVVVVSGSVTGCDFDPRLLQRDPAALLAQVRVPVVAAVSGPCRSVGLELILAADFRICHPSSTFGFPDVQQGRLPCWGATQRLPRVVGIPYALSLLLLGETWDATVAHTRRLVSGVVENLDDGVEHIVENLLDKGPLALEYAKEAVYRGAELPLHEGLRLEGDLNTLLQSSADRAEGLDAFFSKRAPNFLGR